MEIHRLPPLQAVISFRRGSERRGQAGRFEVGGRELAPQMGQELIQAIQDLLIWP